MRDSAPSAEADLIKIHSLLYTPCFPFIWLERGVKQRVFMKYPLSCDSAFTQPRIYLLITSEHNSGCGGNSNNYRTKAECRRRCFEHMGNTTKDVSDEERSEYRLVSLQARGSQWS